MVKRNHSESGILSFFLKFCKMGMLVIIPKAQGCSKVKYNVENA